MNYQPRHSTEAEEFKRCFSALASFLGRPSAPTVLFSGIPIGPGTVTIQARIRYDVTLWVNGYQEAQPTYTYTGPATNYDTGELSSVNTNH